MVPVPKPRCTICARSDVRSINHALRDAGAVVKDVATRFGVPYPALHRHRKNHVKDAPEVKPADAAIVADEDGDLVAQLERHTARLETLFDRAATKGRISDVTKLAREMRGFLELFAKVKGQIKDGPTVNVFNAPAWGTVQAAIIAALAPYPEAKAAVVRALEPVTVRAIEVGAG